MVMAEAVAFIVALLLIALVFYFAPKLKSSGNKLADFNTCGLASVAGGEGRCFASDNCDGKPGWSPLPGGLGCKDQTCCILSDRSAYYPANTMLLKVTEYKGGSVTLRLEAQKGEDSSDYTLETGTPGKKHDYHKGIPRTATFQLLIRPGGSGDLYCQANFLRSNKVKEKPVPCSATAPTNDGFVALTEPLNLQTLDGRGPICSQFPCTIHVQVTKAHTESMTGSSDTLPQPETETDQALKQKISSGYNIKFVRG